MTFFICQNSIEFRVLFLTSTKSIVLFIVGLDLHLPVNPIYSTLEFETRKPGIGLCEKKVQLEALPII